MSMVGRIFLLHEKRLLLPEMYPWGNFWCNLYAGGQNLPPCWNRVMIQKI